MEVFISTAAHQPLLERIADMSVGAVERAVLNSGTVYSTLEAAVDDIAYEVLVLRDGFDLPARPVVIEQGEELVTVDGLVQTWACRDPDLQVAYLIRRVAVREGPVVPRIVSWSNPQ